MKSGRKQTVDHARIIAVASLRRGDGRPLYGYRYVAALFGTSRENVCNIMSRAGLGRPGKRAEVVSHR